MKSSTEIQSTRGHEILNILEKLVELSGVVRIQSDSFRSNTERIVKTMEDLKRLSDESSSRTADLARSLDLDDHDGIPSTQKLSV